ncbi:MAG TPA: 5-bromo-4-chloroindolyl phosphate hydrolysis family protein [Candidatus Pullichristensenella stercorigallinarum]|uniref:5-bromo-4-chloroindolyl phosphate hydrolysis family protein n=1 Tax=Candidatus Pullichristensenella stercorigallinarum TaxID=2840909 RepID=A0A9D0ZPR0_9FIRM|nr:5-bromo-4-chloroindolyl phosphate hydrolysis family protein [Candidatus Pullichristensenella stercorigallinarum]
MKTVKIKSAIPLYLSALTWILFGLFAPIYELIYIVIAACVSLAVYMVASVFFPGRTVEVETAPDSGDEQVNRQIAEGRAALRSLREADEAIADEAVSARLKRMTEAGAKIFDALEKEAARAAEVRRFMNYYLPTADKLLKQYRDLLKTGSQGENIQGAMRSIENSLELIATAFEKQLDSLYRHEAMDIQTDIDVLETMLAADGIRVDSKQKDKEETGNV